MGEKASHVTVPYRRLVGWITTEAGATMYLFLYLANYDLYHP